MPETYALSASIEPQRYHVELFPVQDAALDRVRVEGRVVMDFLQRGTNGPSQLVLDSKHLVYKSHRLFVIEGSEAAEAAAVVRARRSAHGRFRRDEEEARDGELVRWMRSVLLNGGLDGISLISGKGILEKFNFFF